MIGSEWRTDEELCNRFRDPNTLVVTVLRRLPFLLGEGLRSDDESGVRSTVPDARR
jgi:hypothetical protein